MEGSLLLPLERPLLPGSPHCSREAFRPPWAEEAFLAVASQRVASCRGTSPRGADRSCPPAAAAVHAAAAAAAAGTAVAVAAAALLASALPALLPQTDPHRRFLSSTQEGYSSPARARPWWKKEKVGPRAIIIAKRRKGSRDRDDDYSPLPTNRKLQ